LGVIVVKDKELKDKIVDIIMEASTSRRIERPRFSDAPVFIVVCGDVRTKIFYPHTVFKVLDGKIHVEPNPRTEKTFYSSLASAFLHIHLAAHALGLGSQWISGTSHSMVQSKIKNLLGIPEQLEIYDTVALGYPAVQPKPRSMRTLEDITHYNLYDKQKFRTDNKIITLAS
jgi:nitroreductase